VSWILPCLIAVSLQQGAFLESLCDMNRCPNCFSGPPSQERHEGHNLMIFMTFSAPLETWKDLSAQLEMTDGIFLVRGLPGDSFERLVEKIVELRMEGVNAPIDIDPEKFEKYGIESVPAFILEEGGQSDRIHGNLRLDAALREIREKGDTSQRAKELLQRIERGEGGA
jgi:conjugal transfer pilus assembly protein TrbC